MILGAAGSLARVATRYLLDNSDGRLTLYLRQADRLINQDPSRITIIEGDVLDTRRLKAAMDGQEIVYANLAGDMKKQAQCIVQAMKASGVKRLIFISSMGIYDERANNLPIGHGCFSLRVKLTVKMSCNISTGLILSRLWDCLMVFCANPCWR